jgi:phospholipase D1/2
MLDPSTHANPLALPSDANDKTPGLCDKDDQGKETHASDVSKHTFYIENSQMRLKLVARNEVGHFFHAEFIKLNIIQRQMLQWITALEKVASASHYTSNHRFDSFAPIRLNVAAQWLVDGVSVFNWIKEVANSTHSVIISGTFHVRYCLPVKQFTFTIGGSLQVKNAILQ